MASQGDISFGLAIGAGQSVRRNAGDSAFEAYTPSSGGGLTWATSVNGATGTGVALALDNSYAASGIGQSITIGNTQTNALSGLKIDTGTANVVHRGLEVYTRSGSGIAINRTATAALSGITIGISINGDSANYTTAVNTNSSFPYMGMYIYNSQNAQAGTENTGIFVYNSSTELDITTGSTDNGGGGIMVYQAGVNGTSISVATANNINASTNGLVNYTLSNTQSGASVMQKIDLGTSARAHTGLLVNVYNASSTVAGIKIDQSTTSTGKGLFLTGTGGDGAARIYFESRIANSANSGYGIHFADDICVSSGSGYGIYMGAINNITTGNGYGWYVASCDAAGTNKGRYFSLNNAQSASLTAKTVDASEILHSRTNTATTGTVADNFNLTYLKRTNVQNGAGGTLTSAGSVLKLENVATQTAGTLTDTVDVLLLDQDTDSTGKILNARTGGTTKFAISATGALTTTPLTDGAVGFLNIPQNSQSAAYTTVAADSGKHIYHPSADTTARTWTIDSNANVAYPIGTAISFVNDISAGVLTISITSDTLVLAGSGTTGSRTLAAGNIATAIKITSTKWMISGSSGLT